MMGSVVQCLRRPRSENNDVFVYIDDVGESQGMYFHVKLRVILGCDTTHT